jgi:hypothetical protein
MLIEKDDRHTRETAPMGVAPLVPPLRPGQVFADLAAALHVTPSAAHIELATAMANIGVTAEDLTLRDLVRLAPDIRRVADYLGLVQEAMRTTIHEHVEKLMRDAELAPQD